MASPNPKTSQTAEKSKLSLGNLKQQGLYDPPAVKTKVTQWQKPMKNLVEEKIKNGGTPRVIGSTSPKTPLSAGSAAPKDVTGDGATGAEGNTTLASAALGTADTEEDKELQKDLKAASAPRKRVVSDEHWRKARGPAQQSSGIATPPKLALEPKAAFGPKPTLGKILVDEFYVGEESKRIEGWVRRKSTPRKPPPQQAEKSPLGAASPNQRNVSSPKPDVAGKVDVPASPALWRVLAGREPLVMAREAKVNITPEVKQDGDSELEDSASPALRRSSAGREQLETPKEIKVKTTPERSAKRKVSTPIQLPVFVVAPSPEASPPEVVVYHAKPRSRKVSPRRTPTFRDRRSDERKRSPAPVKISPKASGGSISDSCDPLRMTTPPPQGNRLHAWLSNTQDPFIDNDSGLEDDAACSPISTADTGYFVKPRKLSVRKVDSRRRTYTYQLRDKSPTDRVEKIDNRRVLEPSTSRDRTETRHESRDNDDFVSRTDVSPSDDVETKSLSQPSSLPMSPTLTLRRRGARRGMTTSKPQRNADTELPLAAILAFPPPRSLQLAEEQPTREAHEMKVPKADDIVLPLRISTEARTDTLWRQSPYAPQTRLSTIASVETLRTNIEEPHSPLGQLKSETQLLPLSRGLFQRDQKQEERSDLTLSSRPRTLQHMTSHADLMSVLSMADDDGRPLKAVRSVRSTHPTAPPSVTLAEIMDDLKVDEAKYCRELCTLVDGVIPVLLNCVLSRSHSAVVSGLFANSKTDLDPTAPIVAMGVALERLKSAHQRICTNTPEALLLWAQSTLRIYEDYLAAWRMGFQDVVVNLERAEPSTTQPNDNLMRDDEGYIVNDDGGKVDVAYLLKRPLVRLKYLTRTLKDVDAIKSTEGMSLLASKYQDLVKAARRKQDEERARLEDEAAANIDPSRARNLQTLEPLVGVKIDPGRCVKARDVFTLKFQHSSGQRIDCSLEFILRESPPERNHGSDILICEIDSSIKWLFIPPIEFGKISARPGDTDDELVAMIRGASNIGGEWSELLTLRAGNAHIRDDWLELLGSNPLPPALVARHDWVEDTTYTERAVGSPSSVNRSGVGLPTSSAVDVPIGEQSALGVQYEITASIKPPDRSWFSSTISPVRPRSSSPLRPSSISPSQLHTSPLAQSRSEVGDGRYSPSTKRKPVPTSGRCTPPKSPLALTSPYPLWSTPGGPPQPPSHRQTPRTPGGSESTAGASWSQWRQNSPNGSTISQNGGYNVWLPEREGYESDEAGGWFQSTRPLPSQRPGMESGISGVPGDPATPMRGGQPGSPRAFAHSNAPDHDPARQIKPSHTQSPARDGPYSRAQGRPSSPPKVPGSRQYGRTTARQNPSTPKSDNRRRSSSPLKREYHPSDSDSSSALGDYTDDESITSESSADEVGGGLPFVSGLLKSVLPSSLRSPKSPATLTPSQSASQGPYRSVPDQPEASTKTIASLFYWADKGSWESVHRNECTIIVTPGLIEAFDLSALHSSEASNSPKPRPLIALELTPLVPLRRGTALDISIRSPPTPASTFQNSNNIMFRSRNAQECDTLYSLINQSRINNPTYIALQNGRAPGSTWASYMDRKADKRSHSAWWRFGGRRSSYRKSNTWRSATGASSSVAQTDNSATRTSALEAVKRFTTGGGGRAFSIARSTVTSRGRVSGSSTTFTSSSSSGGAGGDGTGFGVGEGRPPAGITNALSIRLYARETLSKWRDMGPAKLTIMHPPASTLPMLGIHSVSGSSTPNNALSPPQTSTQPQGKRILVTGKTRGEVLLDVVLTEQAFERVARTGIAMHVWEENRGPNGQVGVVGSTGGVIAGRGRVWMLQMKSEAETAYAFGLVSRLRY